MSSENDEAFIGAMTPQQLEKALAGSHSEFAKMAERFARMAIDNKRLRDENRTLRQWRERALRAFENVSNRYTEDEGWVEVSRLEDEAVTLPPPS